MSVIHADNNFIPINNNSHLKSVTETSRLCWEPFSLIVVLLPALFQKYIDIIHCPLIGPYVPNKFIELANVPFTFSICTQAKQPLFTNPCVKLKIVRQIITRTALTSLDQ